MSSLTCLQQEKQDRLFNLCSTGDVIALHRLNNVVATFPYENQHSYYTNLIAVFLNKEKIYVDCETQALLIEHKFFEEADILLVRLLLSKTGEIVWMTL